MGKKWLAQQPITVGGQTFTSLFATEPADIVTNAKFIFKAHGYLLIVKEKGAPTGKTDIRRSIVIRAVDLPANGDASKIFETLTDAAE